MLSRPASQSQNVRRTETRTMNNTSASLTYIAPVFRVTDISRSLSFYRDRLGFAVEFVYEDFYAGVCRDDCRIHLKCARPPTSGDQAAFERAEHVDVCIGVQRAAELSAQFTSAGVPFAVALREMPYGTEFYVRDPDGYVLGFVQPAANSS
jgi:catechol 2,3-dioxygenase-like lactoylglutathione lyase family enzyme